jgi:general L-amino acid transport system permease protein
MLRLFIFSNIALLLLGYGLGQTRVGKVKWVMVGWVLSLPIIVVLLRGLSSVENLPLVETTLWGGLLVNLLLAGVGIAASFPIGVLLALGRRSSLPVVKVFSTLFIEIIRGVPLVSILFMASIMLPLFLPEDFRIDRLIRALIGITMFSAAYMAENVRGGLQAIPLGQYDAAKAIGLSGTLTTFLIVLPQALRLVIPAIVGQFISLFKDTTLVLIVGLTEILQIGKSIVAGNPEWVGAQAEVYVFVAVVFWVFTYSMSHSSRRVEKALGVGER